MFTMIDMGRGANYILTLELLTKVSLFALTASQIDSLLIYHTVEIYFFVIFLNLLNYRIRRMVENRLHRS